MYILWFYFVGQKCFSLYCSWKSSVPNVRKRYNFLQSNFVCPSIPEMQFLCTVRMCTFSVFHIVILVQKSFQPFLSGIFWQLEVSISRFVQVEPDSVRFCHDIIFVWFQILLLSPFHKVLEIWEQMSFSFGSSISPAVFIVHCCFYRQLTDWNHKYAISSLRKSTEDNPVPYQYGLPYQ